jgi:mycothiol synthase
MREWLSAIVQGPPDDAGPYGRGLPVFRALRRVAALPPFRGPLRRRLRDEVTVRPLDALDVDALLAFANEHLRFPTWFLERQLLQRWGTRGAAVGAVDAAGRLWGFAYLDQYSEEDFALEGWWIRALMVDPRARGLGFAGRVVKRLCALGRAQGVGSVFADVRAENARSLRLFRRCGFQRAEAVWEARARAVLEAARPESRWLVLERRVDAFD